MKTTEIKELSVKEIIEKIEETQNTLVRIKMNHVISPLDNPQKIVEVRRLVAKLKTELTRRQLKK